MLQVSTARGAELKQLAGATASPVALDTQLKLRVVVPPPQVASQPRQLPATHVSTTHGAVLHLSEVTFSGMVQSALSTTLCPRRDSV
jgi:hypothetical protein